MGKKLVSWSLLLAMILLLLSSCSPGYGAEILDDEVSLDYLREDFRRENRVRGAIYKTEKEYDDSLPRFRVFILQKKEEIDAVFSDFGAGWDVNFEEEMLILYTVTAYYHNPIKIKTIDLEEDKLYIELKMRGGVPGRGDISTPFQRFVLIKTDRLDVTETEIVLTEALF